MGLMPFQINECLTKKLLHNVVIDCYNSTLAFIRAGAIVGSDDGDVVMELPTTLTLDITASGDLGLDTGSEAANTWYYIWLIWRPDTGAVSAIFSASYTTPTLPSGYTKKRLIGTVYNDSSSNFVLFTQRDRSVQIANLNPCFSGSYGSLGLTGVSIANFVPPVSMSAEILAHGIVQVVGTSWTMYVGEGNSGTVLHTILDTNNALYDENTNTATVHCDSVQNIAVMIAASGATTATYLLVVGYTMNLI